MISTFDDDDAPEFTAEVKARARPARDVLPPEVLAAFGRPRGRPRVEAPRVQVSLRLDPEILDYYRGTGPGWQGRLNAALRKTLP